MIDSVDEFILLDDVQYTRRDWRNRNRIKTSQGLMWLTIPVQVKGNFLAPIREIKVTREKWASKHYATIQQAYARANCFHDESKIISEWYNAVADMDFLWQVNDFFTRQIMKRLGISTPIRFSSELACTGEKGERLIALLKKVGAKRYVSGPAAAAYIDNDMFVSEGIEIEWMKYGPYPEYDQLHGSFVHEVSVLDLLLNLGHKAKDFFRKCNYVE